MALEVGKIAAVLTDDGAATQAMLAAVVANWRSAGAEIAGPIGELHGLPDRTCDAEINRIAGEVALKSPDRDTEKAEMYFQRARRGALAASQVVGTPRSDEHGPALAR